MRRRVFALAGVVILLGALGAATLAILVSARSDLREGAAQFTAAQAAATQSPAHASLTRLLTQIRGHVSQAHLDLQRAHDRLSLVAPLIEPLGWLPRYGQELSAAPAAASLALATDNGLLHLLSGLGPVATTYDRQRASHAHRPGPLLAALAEGKPDFERSCLDFAGAGALRGRVPVKAVPGYETQLKKLYAALARLKIVCAGLAILPQLLGYPHARSYLVAYQNNAELRATGGFIGSAGIVRVASGSVSQNFHGTGFQSENLTLRSPEPMYVYNDEPYWTLRDANWSPDFPTTAAVERYMAQLDLHREVNGVINLTPDAAAGIVGAIGSLYLPEYHRTVNGTNVAQLADYYTHWAPSPGPLHSSDPGTQRKQFIAIVFQHAFQQFTHLNAHQLIDLGNNLAHMSEQRSLLAYFDDPAAEGLLRTAGATGVMNTTSTDYLYVVDTNLSYNKINPYIDTGIDDRVRLRPDGWLDVDLRLRVTNGTPLSLESAHYYGPGGGLYGGSLDYADFLRIYAPDGAQLVDQTGWSQPWSGGPAYGKTMFCGYLIVRRGTTAVVRLRYVVPPNVLTWSHGTRYRLLIQHQPGSHPVRWTVRLDDGTTQYLTMHSAPLVDWTLTRPITPRAITPIPLAHQPPVNAGPGHLLEPHAFLQRAS